MKVTLEFDGIEEQEEIQTALYGYKYKLALNDLDDALRKTTKYGVSIIDPNQEANSVEIAIADHYRELIREILNDYNIGLD